jgi:hypothetical protein
MVLQLNSAAEGHEKVVRKVFSALYPDKTYHEVFTELEVCSYIGVYTGELEGLGVNATARDENGWFFYADRKHLSKAPYAGKINEVEDLAWDVSADLETMTLPQAKQKLADRINSMLKGIRAKVSPQDFTLREWSIRD